MARRPIDPEEVARSDKTSVKTELKGKKGGRTLTVTATTTVPVPDAVVGMRHRLFAVYIQDVQERGIDHIYNTYIDETDGKPLFPKHISLSTAKKWAVDGNWLQLRNDALADLEVRTLESLRDFVLKARIQEMRELLDIRASLVEHLGPKRDRKTGAILRHPLGDELEGLPMLNYEVRGGYTKLLEAFLKLDAHTSEKRDVTMQHLGNVVDDAKGVDPSAPAAPTEHATTPEQDLVRRLAVTPERMRKMAHELLRTEMDAEAEDDEEEAEEESDDDEAIEVDEV